MTHLQQVRLTPWKALNELRRYLALPVIRLYFSFHGVQWQDGWRVYGLPLIQRHGGSAISIGRNLQMRNWFSTNPLGIHHRCVLATWSEGAVIEIGEGVGLSGATICAQNGIRIGSRVRVGANSTIADTDFHPLDAFHRRREPKAGRSEPVVIEDDAFIGMSVLVLKGSHIGAGTVVGAGSVVTGTVPPGVVVAGNPARIVHELPQDDDAPRDDTIPEHL